MQGKLLKDHIYMLIFHQTVWYIYLHFCMGTIDTMGPLIYIRKGLGRKRCSWTCTALEAQQFNILSAHHLDKYVLSYSYSYIDAQIGSRVQAGRLFVMLSTLLQLHACLSHSLHSALPGLLCCPQGTFYFLLCLHMYVMA